MESGIQTITRAGPAAVLFHHPLRIRLLHAAAEPASATEIATRLRLSRQLVNYHLKELARVRLVRKAGTRRRRNMIEQRWVASARSYLVAPSILGPLAAGLPHAGDQASAAFLLAATARLQTDLIAATRAAGAEAKRVASLTVHSEVCFESAAQRRQFAEHLHRAVLAAVRHFTAPRGRRYRLVLACAPIPTAKEKP